MAALLGRLCILLLCWHTGTVLRLTDAVINQVTDASMAGHRCASQAQHPVGCVPVMFLRGGGGPGEATSRGKSSVPREAKRREGSTKATPTKRCPPASARASTKRRPRKSRSGWAAAPAQAAPAPLSDAQDSAVKEAAGLGQSHVDLSPWSHGEEVHALPGVVCPAVSACEAALGMAGSDQEIDLVRFPREPTGITFDVPVESALCWERPAAAEDESVVVVDKDKLVGVDRLKHGLRGYSAGPSQARACVRMCIPCSVCVFVCTFDIAGASQELLQELRREGRPGRWNSSDPLERSRPWRPCSELWMPGHETFKYVGPHLGLS